MGEREKQIQIKKSIFTKVFYTAITLVDEVEQGNIIVTDEIYNNLLEIQNEFSGKVGAMKAREEYTKNLMEKK